MRFESRISIRTMCNLFVSDVLNGIWPINQLNISVMRSIGHYL